MKVLVTGALGFIGKNLGLELQIRGHEVLKFDKDSTDAELAECLAKADYVVHLAGINRPLSKEEFYDGNTNFTIKLLDFIKATGRKIPMVFSSTIQAALDNDYGKSKRMAEDAIFDFMEREHSSAFIFRLANVFGKWSRPNYNSVVATFCHNICRDLPIEVRDPTYAVNLVYIDDIVARFASLLESGDTSFERTYYSVDPVYAVTLGELADKLYAFRKTRSSLFTPENIGGFDRKLYATYLSYYPTDDFAYDLKVNSDNRGSFTEVLRTTRDGQISVNISKPGITKGNHYHRTKSEKFIVVSGRCEIKFRKIGEEQVFTYAVDADKMRVVDIPPGYTHSIKNIGSSDSVTIMWASELFDKNDPDTIFEEVEKNGK